jgi:hypothetical protein
MASRARTLRRNSAACATGTIARPPRLSAAQNLARAAWRRTSPSCRSCCANDSAGRAALGTLLKKEVCYQLYTHNAAILGPPCSLIPHPKCAFKVVDCHNSDERISLLIDHHRFARGTNVRRSRAPVFPTRIHPLGVTGTLPSNVTCYVQIKINALQLPKLRRSLSGHSS